MARGLLAIYLMLVTAAGPSLCCCSVFNLIARSPDHSSCCHEANTPPPCCQSPTDTTSINPDEQNEKQPTKDAPGECPCRKQNAKSVTLEKQHSLDLHEAVRFGLNYLLSHLDNVQGVSQTITLVGTQSDRSPAHFLTAEDLLNTHHQLRC